MKKQILNLGKVLSKTEQRNVNGGYESECETNSDCDPSMFCNTRNICSESTLPDYDNFGCDVNPFTNPYGIGC